METYSTEEQQIAAIKRFVGEHGTKTLTIIVLLIAGILSYQGYQHTQKSNKETASLYFSELDSLVGDQGQLGLEQQVTFDTNFNALLEEYPDSVYASYASLLKAKLAVDKDDLDAATVNLQWVIDAGFSQDMTDLATLRLARVTFAQGDLDKALSMLDGYKGTFEAQYLNTKADILVAKGDEAAALEAYQAVKAVNAEKAQQSNDFLLDMKIETLEANQNAELYSVNGDTASTTETAAETK